MPSDQFDFQNGRGQTLSGRLERPDGPVAAYALFAHCFSCAKTSIAAVRVTRALAAMGVATLRFDFTGLGHSEGEFARDGFSGDVADIAAAAAAMAEAGCPPSLLVGHSLGGAAVLAAARDIESARAVAVIGAPSDPKHVLGQLGAELAKVEAEGQAEVTLGGRPFTVSKSFVDDVRMQTVRDRIASLGRALLVLHSPVDDTVSIENASSIFLAARHPKSFVSLDTADHLLTKAEDAEYAARVIAAWVSRYLPAADAPPAATAADVLVAETGAGKFQVEVSAGGIRFHADEPVDVGGLGSGPSPFELVSAGLGACTAMTLRLYAQQKGWPLERTRVAVRHDKPPGATPPDRFVRRIAFEGPLSPEQVQRLFEIADKCPVHRTLETGSKIETAPLEAPMPPPACAEPAKAHFCEMEKACKDEG
jgi:putative redox protein